MRTIHNEIIDKDNQTFVMRGVSKSSLEYLYVDYNVVAKLIVMYSSAATVLNP